MNGNAPAPSSLLMDLSEEKFVSTKLYGTHWIVMWRVVYFNWPSDRAVALRPRGSSLAPPPIRAALRPCVNPLICGRVRGCMVVGGASRLLCFAACPLHLLRWGTAALHFAVCPPVCPASALLVVEALLTAVLRLFCSASALAKCCADLRATCSLPVLYCCSSQHVSD